MEKTDDGSKNFKFGIGIGLCKRKKNASGVILITKDLVTQTQRNTVSGINLGVSIGCTVPSSLFVPVVLPLLYIRNYAGRAGL